MWIRQPGSPSGVEKEIDSPRARDPPNPCHINTLKHMVITSHGHPICWAGKPKPVKTTRPNCPSHHVSDPLRQARKKWIPADMARALALFSEICCEMWPGGKHLGICGPVAFQVLTGNSATRNPGFILGSHPISRLLSLGHPIFTLSPGHILPPGGAFRFQLPPIWWSSQGKPPVHLGYNCPTPCNEVVFPAQIQVLKVFVGRRLVYSSTCRLN